MTTVKPNQFGRNINNHFKHRNMHKRMFKGLENRIEVLTAQLKNHDRLISLAGNFKARMIG